MSAYYNENDPFAAEFIRAYRSANSPQTINSSTA